MDERLMDVEALCAQLDIELQGEEGHPFHCGERMQTKSGVIGVDYARCRKCGLTIGNLLSPHINLGKVPTYEWFEQHSGKTWARIDNIDVREFDIPAQQTFACV